MRSKRRQFVSVCRFVAATTLIVIALLLASAVGAQNADGVLYDSPLDLGNLAGPLSDASTTPSGLTEDGQVVGTTGRRISRPEGGWTTIDTGFRWDRGAMTSLGTVNGRISRVFDVKADGSEAVGEVEQADGRKNAVLFRNNQVIDLGMGSGSSAWAINRRGDIAGIVWRQIPYENTRPLWPHVFILSGGVTRDLGIPGVVRDMNDAGELVGEYSPPGRPPVGFYYRPDIGLRLLTIPNGSFFPSSLTESGVMVGWADIRGGPRAAIYRDGQLTLIPTLGGWAGFGEGINKAGQVVGEAWTTGNKALRPFLYFNGKVWDLNDLIPPGSGWTLETATAINSQGFIIGTGMRTGSAFPRGYLLFPRGRSPQPKVVLKAVSVGASVPGTGYTYGSASFFNNQTLLWSGKGGGGEARGANAMFFRSDGTPVERVHHDLWADRHQGDAFRELIKWLNSRGDGVLLFAACDDLGLLSPPYEWTEALLSSLERLGAQQIRRYPFRGSYALAARREGGRWRLLAEDLKDGAEASVSVELNVP